MTFTLSVRKRTHVTLVPESCEARSGSPISILEPVNFSLVDFVNDRTASYRGACIDISAYLGNTFLGWPSKFSYDSNKFGVVCEIDDLNVQY